MTIFYKLQDKLYVNITNNCPCDCVFCLRVHHDTIGDAQSLWLPREPSLDEIKAAFDACDLGGITEIVFCGFGEPLERADIVVSISKYIRSKCDIPIRINTNGLVKMRHPDFDMLQLAVVDFISVSLNADDEDEYLRLTRSRFGKNSYSAVLDFAREAKKYADVTFTVVQDVIDEARTARCREIAKNMGIPLRIRGYIE